MQGKEQTQSNTNSRLYELLITRNPQAAAIFALQCNGDEIPQNIEIITANEQFYEKISSKATPITGSELLEIASPDLLKRVCEVQRSGLSGEVEWYSSRLKKYFKALLFTLDESHLAIQIEDVSEKKRREQQQTELMVAVEHSEETIVITDTDGTITYVNPAFEKTSGYTREEAIGENPRLLKSGSVPAVVYEDLWRQIRAGKTWRGTFINSKKGGEIYHEDATISPIFNSEGDICNYVAVKRDITKEIKLKEQMAQIERVEALGFLAGGIAHDFNNILGGIIGFTQMSLTKVDDESPLKKYLSNILSASERAAKIVEQIETYSSKQSGEITVVEIPALIEELVNFIEKTTPPTVKIHYKKSGEILPIRGTTEKLNEALLNVITNSLYAISKSGEIEIFLHSSNVVKEIVTPFNIIPAGIYTTIEISDNGCGIPESVLKNIFDPFYTTKSLDIGSGMGLSVVFGVVKSHDGFVDVQSSLGLGTLFKIYLPAVAHDAKEETKEEFELPHGSERILLIDDEELLLGILEEMIRTLGYSVTAFNSPKDALLHFQEHSSDYDLVYTDYLMPQISGIELSEKIHAIRAEIPIILSTGNRDEIQEDKQSHIEQVIKKPLRLEEIAKILSAIFKNKRIQ